MSDALPDDAWINAFLSSQPRPLLTSLQRRLQTSSAHVNAIAELYHERSVIEQEYAAKLSKLARSAESGTLTGKGGIEWDRNSGEARLWDLLVADIAETSSAHSTLSALLKTDFEQPIRDLPNKIIPWRRINEQDLSLDRALKEYEKTSSKLEKASSKSKSSKADQLAAELNQITNSLSSLSPMVYTTYQRLDEERLRGLKEVIVRWATVRADMATKDGERAEASVAKLLGWETADEVLTIGIKLGGSGGTRASARSGTPTIASPIAHTSNRRTSVATNATGDFSPRPPLKQQNGSATSIPTGGGSGSGGGFTGGFKSMLTRKATVISSRQRSGSEATSTRSSRRPTADVFEALEEDDRLPSSDTPVDEEGYSIAPADRHRNPWEDPTELIPTPATRVLAPTSAKTTTTAENLTSSPVASQEALSSPVDSIGGGSGTPRLNLSLATAPIKESDEEVQAALTKMQQTLQLAPQPSRRSTIARGRREVRSTMFGINGEDGTVSLGGITLGKLGEDVERLADTPPGSAGSIPSSATSLPSAPLPLAVSDNEFAPVSSVPPPTSAASPPATKADDTTPDDPSHRSISTVNPFETPSALDGNFHPSNLFAHVSGVKSSLSSAPPISADAVVTESGLRVAMVETISTARRGSSQATDIVGEIYLSLQPRTDRPIPAGTIHIRLTHFDALDNVAPNPSFLAQVPDRPGEYYLNAGLLAQATLQTGNAVPGTLLFQYHVLVEAGQELGKVPLVLNPAFQVRDGETRMILQYHGNSTAGAAALTDLSLAALFAGTEPPIVNTQSKPVQGIWTSLPSDDGSNTDRRVAWNPVVPTADGEGKIVARFVTSPGAAPLIPLRVVASFVMPDHLLSGLGIEVMDSEAALGGWTFEDIQRSTVSGTYICEPSLNA